MDHKVWHSEADAATALPEFEGARICAKFYQSSLFLMVMYLEATKAARMTTKVKTPAKT